jgi:hypothetical protein
VKERQMPVQTTDSQWRRSPRDHSLRAADRDRETVAEILRQQHLAGRIDSDEFQLRLEHCLAAKTYAELDQLIVDLPGEQQPRAVSRRWRWPVLAIVPLLIAAIALSRDHLFWVTIPLFFLFVARPLIWRSASRRLGWWGWWGCTTRYTTQPGPRA